MSEVRQIAPGLIELSTNKHIDQLEKDGDVVAIYEKDKEKAKVLIDMSAFLEDNIRYVY